MQLKKWFVLLLTVTVGAVAFAMPVPSDENDQIVTAERAEAVLASVKMMANAPGPEGVVVPENELNTNLEEMAEAFLKRELKKESVTDEDCDQFIKQEREKEIESDFQAGKISELTRDQQIYNLYRSSFTKEDLKMNVKKNLLASFLKMYVKKDLLTEDEAKRAYVIYVTCEGIRAETKNALSSEE